MCGVSMWFSTELIIANEGEVMNEKRPDNPEEVRTYEWDLTFDEAQEAWRTGTLTSAVQKKLWEWLSSRCTKHHTTLLHPPLRVDCLECRTQLREAMIGV